MQLFNKPSNEIALLKLIRKLAQQAGMGLNETPFEKYKNIDRWYLKYRELSLVYDTSERHSKWWFFPRYDEGRIHEPKATDIFIDFIKRDSIVLDIGAHLGYFSCIAGKLAKNGLVYVFEVDPKCINLISYNLKLNNLDNVLIHNLAVSNSNGTVRIPQLEKPNPSLIINSNSSSNYIEVESVTIDDFLAQNNINPDFIKIDIEGAEWDALQGMKHTLEYGHATILIEIHVDNLRKNFDIDYKKIIKLLVDSGYILNEIEHRRKDGKMSIVYSDTELLGNTMILCTKKATNTV